MKRAVAILLSLLLAIPAQAQLPGGVQQSGAVTAGHCVSWKQNGIIQDGGGACGAASSITVGTTTIGGSPPSGGVLFSNAGVLGASSTTLTTAGALNIPSGQVLSWNGDAGISRSAAATFLFGNGTQGSTTGLLEATSYISLGGSFSWNGSTIFRNPPANGKVLVTNSGNTAGVVMDLTTDGQLRLFGRDGTTAGVYASGNTVGVSCGAGTINLTTAVATNGILTHC